MSSQITPTKIENHLKDRLFQTNKLWNSNNNDLDQEKLVVFLYFFDISSAIESCFRNIVLEYSKCSSNGKLLGCFSDISNDNRPFFLDAKHIQALFGDVSLSSIVSQNGFERFCMDIDFLKYTNISNLGYDFADINCLISKYDSIKRQRNKMAHGLLAYANGDFSQTCLCDFCYLYYLLFNLYKDKYGTII